MRYQELLQALTAFQVFETNPRIVTSTGEVLDLEYNPAEGTILFWTVGEISDEDIEISEIVLDVLDEEVPDEEEV